MLYLVATPIGNLSDITLRAIEILKSCDYILCEDTRHSQILLRHYAIHKPLKSFHKFNESACEAAVLADLSAGKNIALISDAGTPGIADPGSNLVIKCVEQGLPVTAIPGACAAIAALSCSGLPTERFQFFGFLPRKASDLKKAIQEILFYPGTTICYEAPHRLLATLRVIQNLAPDRLLVLERELTKKFEEALRGTAQDLLTHWEERMVKGECILLIAGAGSEPNENWEDLSPKEHVAMLQEAHGLSLQDAIKLAAEMRGVRKREIYNIIHKL